MRHLIVSAVVLMAGPAMAVDYVQCREMLRTKNEMVRNIQNSQALANRRVANDACGSSRDAVGRNAFEPGYEARLSSWNSCVDNAHAQYKATKKGVAVVYVDGFPLKDKTLYDPAAIQWQKSAQKVDLDMKKAGCPYQ